MDNKQSTYPEFRSSAELRQHNDNLVGLNRGTSIPIPQQDFAKPEPKQELLPEIIANLTSALIGMEQSMGDLMRNGMFLGSFSDPVLSLQEEIKEQTERNDGRSMSLANHIKCLTRRIDSMHRQIDNLNYHLDKNIIG